MTQFKMTTTLIGASIFAANATFANTGLTISNACDTWVKISAVHAQTGNMRCEVNGQGVGTNADFFLQQEETAQCSFTTTHGITSVGFTLSDKNPLQTAEVFVNNVGVAILPVVNPIAHKDGDIIRTTCDF